ARDRLQLNVAHHVLQERRTVITGASLAKLDPFAKSVASAASAPAKSAPESASAAHAATTATAASPRDHCDPRS
ncbi:MAG: hypothetical protein WBP37_04040, partial [Candidatus Dechloromonas phosphoritropha]